MWVPERSELTQATAPITWSSCSECIGKRSIISLRPETDQTNNPGCKLDGIDSKEGCSTDVYIYRQKIVSSKMGQEISSLASSPTNIDRMDIADQSRITWHPLLQQCAPEICP